MKAHAFMAVSGHWRWWTTVLLRRCAVLVLHSMSRGHLCVLQHMICKPICRWAAEWYEKAKHR